MKDKTFESFCNDCDEIVGGNQSPQEFLPAIVEQSEKLVENWRMPDPRYLQCQPDAMYGSYLLYLNGAGTFNVVLDVFIPGQAAIIHNHLCWCAFTCLDGVEKERLYTVDAELSGAPNQTVERFCTVGEVRTLGADRNLMHQVECASDTPAVSLHIYGADIGRLERDMWDDKNEKFVSFRSNYSNDVVGLPEYSRS